jgi:hypothetical protein
MDAVLHRRLQRAKNALMDDGNRKYSIHSRDALGPAVRKQLEERRDQLEDALLSADPRRVQINVGLFFQTYPQMRLMDEEDARAHCVRYATVLYNLPDWAIAEAMTKIVDGAKDPSLMPTGADLRTLALDAQAPFIDQLEDIRDVLNARVIEEPATQEQRDRAWEWYESVRNGYFPAESETEEGKARLERAREGIADANKRLADRERLHFKEPDGLLPSTRQMLARQGVNVGATGAESDADYHGGLASDGGRTGV